MKNVVIGFLGTKLDQVRRGAWQPSVKLCAHPDFPIDRLELLYPLYAEPVAERVMRDIGRISPDTEVRLVRMELADPWDFQEVYGKLYDFAETYGFDEDRERYHVHLTTGTHVAQICWFLLTESRHVPARLVQTGPPRPDGAPQGTLDVIDLDLARYNALQRRFEAAAREHSYMLRGGIVTRHPAMVRLVDRLERVATGSDEPVFLLGEAGTGKSTLAGRLYELKLQRRRVKGRLVQAHCAALRGPHAMAALFGQRRNVVGLAGTERVGLLGEAGGGVLLLEDIDLLPLEEQALLLRAIEMGSYYPLGSDNEVTSRFHLIATTCRTEAELSDPSVLRPDLLARLSSWMVRIPALRERPEDMEEELAHAREAVERRLGIRTGFNTDAGARYLRFARDPAARWTGNYRDLEASVLRLCTLAERGRVTLPMVEEEIALLTARWGLSAVDPDMTLLRAFVEDPSAIDAFDRAQLAAVIRVCREARSLSDAGRRLFAVSRQEKASRNDADRLRKYLARFDLDWDAVRAASTG
ncbi:RNA repair transcriptional activator RtcR family protein [Gluconacetobacter sp. Hr-1-5]|uniref:RNA repair transcriptional activator RtcR family protein n=1 Tax=Gluconacetobacter sp. Hr-1-5 TaxID=3395370 RepID=UPI003B5242D5